nr:hypothetical protein [Candidatus Sigynarchaeota archaeon]
MFKIQREYNDFGVDEVDPLWGKSCPKCDRPIEIHISSGHEWRYERYIDEQEGTHVEKIPYTIHMHASLNFGLIDELEELVGKKMKVHNILNCVCCSNWFPTVIIFFSAFKDTISLCETHAKIAGHNCDDDSMIVSREFGES